MRLAVHAKAVPDIESRIMDTITRQIADYASASRFEHLPEDTVHAATQRLVDALGCALGAADCEPAQIGRKLAAGQTPGQYPGAILCHGGQAPLEAASFINTTMIRNLDFNDRYPGGHPSDGLGGLLGFAGAAPTDGRWLITAMTVAYEIFARLADGAKLSRRGWDQGFGVAIATTAGLCNLLGLSREATAHAVGIAATSSLPLRVTRSGELTPWKNAATAYAVRNGVFAALLAREGMIGPGNAFEGRNGLFDNVTGPFELEPFPDKGGRALTPMVQLKYWPVETNGQPVVFAALALRAKVDPKTLTGIEVFTSKFTWFEIGSEPEKWDPKTRETADHSLPYMFARTLVDGPLKVGSFADEAVLDPALRPLMAMIKVTVDDAIEALLPDMALRVVATTKDGARHTVEVGNPLGHPNNPMRDEHINEKVMALAEPVIGRSRSQAALDRWWRVREADDLRPLIRLIEVNAPE
jgi:2-methylcitrate dehydratase